MRFSAVAALLLLVMGMAATENMRSGYPPAAFLCTVAPSYKPLTWAEGGERFEAGAAIFIQDANGHRALLPGFAASADPQVSFDGKAVLLAGKRTAQEKWQIWEVPLAGGDAMRMTNCPQGCVRPFYLPEQRIVYAEKIGARFVIRSTMPEGKVLDLTYGPASSFPSDVLQDGRVLFETVVLSQGKEVSELYTVYSDGSGVESYRCDHGASRHSGKQVASGDVVFADGQGLSRFTSAKAKEIQVSAPRGEYDGDIAETSPVEWLLSWRGKSGAPFALMEWKPGDKMLHRLLQEPDTNVLQPVVLRERAVPNRHPSALHDWNYANLLCLNAYTSKYSFGAGSINSVKFYTRDAAGRTQMLGTSPVEADGSFFVQVPGDQPLQIELLDAAGKTLKHEAGWFWLRRGEQRVCVGCHAGPETAPENAVPMVLLKSTTPVDMTHAGSASMGGH